MSQRGIKGIPERLRLGLACAALLECYKEKSDFLEEWSRLREQSKQLLSEILANAIDILKGKTPEEISEDDTSTLRKKVIENARVQTVIDRYISFCQKRKLDYAWAPKLLLFEDLKQLISEKTDMLIERYTYEITVYSYIFTAITGLPPFLAINFPTYFLYLSSREQIHRFLDDILDSLPHDQEQEWVDLPHAIKKHARWLYAHKCGKSYMKISKDPILNPNGKSVDAGHIRYAVTKLGRLLRNIQ